MIFDEDFNEEITYEEYVDTLDAFGGLLEEDEAQDLSNPRISISKRAMFKVIDMMNIRGITVNEIFELEGSDVIHVDKFKSFIVNNLKVELKRREMYALCNTLDGNLNGYI